MTVPRTGGRGACAGSPRSVPPAKKSRRLRVSLLLACAVAGCGEAARDARQPDSATPPVTVVAATANPPVAPTATSYCADEDEARALACSRGTAWRIGDSLVVRLGGGSKWARVERPDTGGTGYTHYTYHGTVLGQRTLHVITEQLYEMRTTYLVDGQTGKSAVSIGEPVLAPAGSRFAAAAMSLSTCDGVDGLEIWRLTDSLPVRELALAPFDCDHETGWAPSEVAWRAADTLTLVANLAPADSGARGTGTRERRPALVVRDSRGWRLLLPAH